MRLAPSRSIMPPRTGSAARRWFRALRIVGNSQSKPSPARISASPPRRAARHGCNIRPCRRISWRVRNPRWLLLLSCAVMLAASLGAQFKRADTPQTPPPSQSAPAAQPTTDDQVIKVEVALVNLYFTVRDNHGGYVGNLKQDDF